VTNLQLALSAKGGPPFLPLPPSPNTVQTEAQHNLITNDRHNNCCFPLRLGIHGIERQSSINTMGELERALWKTCPFERHMYTQIL
jgi:hypothetical protein